MPIKILVVDDHQPVRQHVCSALEKRAEFQIVAQAVDGLDAVQKAEELQPDLIVLDIGLPKLNGIAAARQIRKVAPKSKILFFSQETDMEIVKASFSTGASGYVVKSAAGNELFEAIETVIHGGQFVSRKCERWLPEVKDGRTTGSHSLPKDLEPSLPHKSKVVTQIHEVQFYSDEEEFLNTFTDFIAPRLKSGNTGIVVATESHRIRLFSKLQTDGVDVISSIEQGNYIPLDVAETLSRFMVNDLPDRVQFSEVVGDLLEQACKVAKGKHPRVTVCGEGVGVLWAQGKGEAAIRLEQLWNEIAKTYDVDLLCAYRVLDFLGKERQDMFQRICAEHTAVYSH